MQDILMSLVVVLGTVELVTAAVVLVTVALAVAITSVDNQIRTV